MTEIGFGVYNCEFRVYVLNNRQNFGIGGHEGVYVADSNNRLIDTDVTRFGKIEPGLASVCKADDLIPAGEDVFLIVPSYAASGSETNPAFNRARVLSSASLSVQEFARLVRLQRESGKASLVELLGVQK